MKYLLVDYTEATSDSHGIDRCAVWSVGLWDFTSSLVYATSWLCGHG